MTVPAQRVHETTHPSHTSRRKRRAAAIAFLAVTGATTVTLVTPEHGDAATLSARPPVESYTTTDGYRQAGAAGGMIGSVGACAASFGWACAAVPPAVSNFEVVQQTTPQVPDPFGNYSEDSSYVPLGPGSI